MENIKFFSGKEDANECKRHLLSTHAQERYWKETTTKNVHTLQLPLTSPRTDWHPHNHITEGRRHVLKSASKTVDSRK
ncbi:hypothetical protein CEXT_596991 [Caerostris extrusa]|uniref:Uncharacterized protein n=1 Tax=Caerostris extrusa TaxID=172846 RepID=A0AAV4UHV7_CAEEX|nr:hypothetical protein CEXT_596991 [Caerostris extrusa]